MAAEAWSGEEDIDIVTDCDVTERCMSQFSIGI